MEAAVPSVWMKEDSDDNQPTGAAPFGKLSFWKSKNCHIQA
jgi:hypothetical protein